MSHPREYFLWLAAAYVRGMLHASHVAAEHPTLFVASLDQLSVDDMHTLVALGESAGLRLHRFKRTMALPRVHKVLGILRGLQPVSLLDIGSGRGAFLWTLLDAFPILPVTSIDVLDYRVADMLAVRAGGVSTLDAVLGDATSMPFTEGQFDVVTMLEVLEHIPDTARALAEVCRVAARFVILSVPSKPDDNPEHIHLFDQATLKHYLHTAGIAHVNVDYVLNHLIVVGRRQP